jgi:transcriptional antiterminator
MMLEKGLTLVGYSYNDTKVSQNTWNDRFRRFYGSDPIVYSKLFEDLKTMTNVEARIQQEHLSLDYFLMSIYFLRCYPTELHISALFNVSERTVRKWVWFYVAKIKELKKEKVSHDNPITHSIEIQFILP